jgi:hypothetical protein
MKNFIGLEKENKMEEKYKYVYECTLNNGVVIEIERKTKIKTKTEYNEITDMVRQAIKEQNKDTENFDTSRYYIIYMLELLND